MQIAKVDQISEQEFRELIANSISMREVTKALGYVNTGANHETIWKRIKQYNISTEHWTNRARGQIKRCPENIFIENSTATQKVVKHWYLKGNYTEYKCAICGQEPFCNNKPLTLTLDHINGKNHDDRLENLRWVCPNCDRQLDTFAGKNLKKKKIE